MGETTNKCGLKGYTIIVVIASRKNMGSTIKHIGWYNEELIEN
jgi:ribosomal protein S16